MTLEWLLVLSTSFGAQAPAPKPAVEPRLRLVQSIDLPGVAGRIDHMAFDRERQRLWVAALEAGAVEVVDVKAGAREKEFRALSGPAGVAFLPELGRVAVATGGGALEVYDAATLEHVTSVAVGDDADNVRWDPRSKRVLVGYGDGALAFVDASTWKVTDRIELGVHPESFQVEAASQRVFVNLPDSHSIAIVDLATKKVASTIQCTEARANYPMTLLAERGLVAVGCRQPAKLLFFDVAKPEPLYALDLSRDVDDVFFDAKRSRLYASCGAGQIDVFELTPGGADARWKLGERVPSSDGARTCLFAPEIDRLFLAAPKRAEKPAQIQVYEVR